MSMLDVHAAALENVNEGYHSFLLKFSKQRKTVYGFVEGKDDPSFYRGAVERFIPDNWIVELITAGNRDKVVSTEKLFDWTAYSRSQIAFFIDRDLSDLLELEEHYADNIYITDGYSIENAIVTPDVLIRILSEVHNVVDWTDEERSGIVEHFQTELRKFQDTMTPLMAQIAEWRRLNVRANLNNLDLSSIYHFSNAFLQKKEGFEDDSVCLNRLEVCVGAPLTCPVSLQGMEARFRAIGGPERLVRGKYLLWFLAMISNEIHQKIDRFVNTYSRPPRSRLTIGQNNLLVVAAPRARIPASLREFLERTFLVHATSHVGDIAGVN